ncbi:MAG: thioredoxin domain-containing protein, partial [Proteobacteria bacterium]
HPQRNRLAAETSPYLLQHAANPVDWHPWDDAALALARREDKPILLSIGYSACHWCHVMAHESFEDPATAALMNELFVNIKVDREERPDLDRIYQLAHQLLTQRAGGWPLTMFLSPQDRRPFFGGTYFPKEARFGLPAFADLLRKVAEFYRTRRTDIQRQGEALEQALAELTPRPAADVGALSLAPLEAARSALAAEFDPEFGGFGTAPKFPQPTNLELLLRLWRASAAGASPDLHSLYMAALTLTRMAEGGLYDQLGGGFSRYAVDRSWRVPHFEKMLYDNAQLLGVYAQAALATGDPLFERVALETAQWMLREMRSPQDAFWSSLDADSQGHEGRFYLWDAAEVEGALTAEQFAVFAPRFGLDAGPNFEGRWHLHAQRPLGEIARTLGIEERTAEARLDEARRALLQRRAQRVRPGRDDKVLTSWNALAIAGLAVAGRMLARPELTQAALDAIDFLRTRLWRDGRLLAVYKEGRARFTGYLDDYAFLLHALLEALQARWRSEDLHLASALADGLLAHFEDRELGGFFFTADDHETLIHRYKSFGDEAIPAGNALAALGLNRLGLLLAEPRWLEAAARALRAAWPMLERYPQAHAASLIALEEHLEPPAIVVIRGPAAEAARWRDALARIYAPKRLVFAIENEAPGLPPALQSKRPADGTAGFICRGMTCSEPVNSLEALIALTRG